jgi:uncharacterized membrane protein
MLGYFREGNFSKGLIEAIEMAGKELKAHYPWQKTMRMNFPMKFHSEIIWK